MKRGKFNTGRTYIRNSHLIGAGKQFKAIRNPEGKISWRKSVRPKEKVQAKTLTKTALRMKPVKAKTNFRVNFKEVHSLRKSTAIKVKTNVSKGNNLQRFRNQVAKTTPNPIMKMKSRQPVKIKPRGRGR